MVKWFSVLDKIISRELNITLVRDKEALKTAGDGVFSIELRDGRSIPENQKKLMLYTIEISVFKSDFMDIEDEISSVDDIVRTIVELAYDNVGQLGLNTIEYIDFRLDRVGQSKVLQIIISFDITFVYRKAI